MRGFVAVVGLVCVLGARGAAAQDERSRSGPVSVQVSAGALVPHGDEASGDVQSVAVGYSPTGKVTVLVGGWRMHRPTTMQRYSDGGTALTRGGTVQFISGEVRFSWLSGERVSPYVFTGGGLGVSRPNVNEWFTNRVTNAAYVAFGGGGVAFPLGLHLIASADLGLFMVGERDVIRPLLPVRAGLAWRF